jgi:hypothetical protein
LFTAQIDFLAPAQLLPVRPKRYISFASVGTIVAEGKIDRSRPTSISARPGGRLSSVATRMTRRSPKLRIVLTPSSSPQAYVPPEVKAILIGAVLVAAVIGNELFARWWATRRGPRRTAAEAV